MPERGPITGHHAIGCCRWSPRVSIWIDGEELNNTPTYSRRCLKNWTLEQPPFDCLQKWAMTSQSLL